MQALDEAKLLEQFAGGDEAGAREAFDALAPAARLSVLRCLRGQPAEPQDREDIVQETLARAWTQRPRFRFQGVAAWHALLHRIARNCRIDQARAGHGALSLDAEEAREPSDEELALVDDLINALDHALTAGTLEAAADELWLGLDRALPPEARTRRLLAAQLFYLGGEEWRTVLRLLPVPAGSGERLDRETLDRWLGDAAVLKLLIYTQLFMTNDALAARLLSLPEPCPASALDQVARQAAVVQGGQGPGGWDWAEAAFILWRYRQGLSLPQILSRRDCRLSPEESQALADRLRALLPFNMEMAEVCTKIEELSGLLPARLCGDPELWQRLAFQYAFYEELAQADILERVEPAARCVGYGLNSGMLNMWLSGHRLTQRLARYVAREGARR